MAIPQLIAHRGHPLCYPENTLIGMEAAVTAGAKFLETDVQLSKDLQPVLFHDRTLERLCNEKGAIHDYKLQELENFRVFEFNRFGYKFVKNPITTLTEFIKFLQQHTNVTAFIEIKRVSLEKFGITPVVSTILRALKPVSDQCVLISYSIQALEAAQKLGCPVLGAVIDNWNERNQNLILTLDPQFLFCSVNGLPRHRQLRLPNRKIAVFDIVDPEQAVALAKRGVDYVETFAIDKMLSSLKTIPTSE